MPFTVTLDNKPGSFLRKGAQTNRFHRAVIRGVIAATGVDTLNNADGLNDAIVEAENAAGLFHPVINDLPLQHTIARRFGPNKIWLWMEYFHRLNNVAPAPGVEYASTSSNRRMVEVFRQTFFDNGNNAIHATHGLPMGRMVPFVKTSPTASEAIFETTWRSRNFYQALIAIHIPFDLNFNPTSDVAFALDTVNQLPITWFGNYSFPTQSLLFDGVASKPYEDANGNVRYRGFYNFAAVRGRWWNQYPQWAEPNGPWDTVEGPEKVATNGWGVFQA